MTKENKIKVIGDSILVKRDADKETETESGLIMNTEFNRQSSGTVLAVGRGRFTISGTYVPLDVKENDKIIFLKGTGIPVKLYGEEYISIKETDIIAVL